jgi:signal transduction histidine kinase
MDKFRWPFPLCSHLVALVVGAMLPFLVLSAVIANWLIKKERADSESRLKSATSELADAVDQEIESTMRTLRSIATLDSLKSGDLRAFHAQLIAIQKSQPSWVTIRLHSRDRKLLLSSVHPYGEALMPVVESGSLVRLFTTGSPTVGAIQLNAPEANLVGHLVFAVRIPVYSRDQVEYALSAVISMVPLSGIVSRSSVPNSTEWTRSLIDTKGIVAARSRTPDRFVGKSAPPQYMDLVSGKGEGLVRVMSFEGVPLFVAFKRTALSGWLANVSIPVEVMEATAARARTTIFSIGGALLALFGSLAFFYARHLAYRIRDVASGAAVLAKGEVPSSRKFIVRELKGLQESLISTGKLLKAREAALKEAKETAESANRLKSQFVAMMSHEIRTPLNSIMGFAEMLVGVNMPADEQREIVEIISRNGHQLTSILDSILDLSQLEDGKLDIKNSRVNLEKFLSDLADQVCASLEDKSLTFKIKVEASIVRSFHIDPNRLSQILTNLIDNAVKFTESGFVHVTVSILPAESLLKFTIKDSGIGIRKEDHAHLFQPFSQVDMSLTRGYGGTGLGLVLSRHIARIMGGNLELAESTPGRGSTFVLTLPLKHAVFSEGANMEFDCDSHESAPDPSHVSRPHLVKAQPPLQGLRVLVAEDSPDNRQVVLRFLEKTGCEIVFAHDGQEAVEKALSDSFDIILMDIRMPRIDGLEATRRLRRSGLGVPIVAVTAHAMSEDIARCMEAGCLDVITKPVNREGLLTMIRKTMDATG